MNEEKWFLINPPKLQDECFYDIELKDGSIIKNVEYWLFGGVFLHEDKEISDAIKFKYIGTKRI